MMTISTETLKQWQELELYQRLRQSATSTNERVQPTTDEQIQAGDNLSFHIHEVPHPVSTTPLTSFVPRIHQDIFLKYQLQKGRDVDFIPQWQQFPSAVEAEETSQLTVGDANPNEWAQEQSHLLEYRKACQSTFLHIIGIRQQELRRLGIFANWKKGRAVANRRDHAKIVTNFNRLVKSGYISQSQAFHRWCGRCHTVLHEEDVSAGKVETLAGLIKFPIYRGLERFGVQVNLAVWISELWQLVGCVAIRLDPTEKYVCWQQEDNCLIVPQSTLNSKRKAQLSVHSKVGIESRSGSSVDILWLDIPESDLAPVAIEEILAAHWAHPYYLDTEVKAIAVEQPYTTHPAKIRGLVPGHVPQDYQLAQRESLPVPCVLDEDGRLTKNIDLLEQLTVAEANQQILAELNRRDANLIVQKHQVPQRCCRTCGQVVTYRPMQEWFFSPTKKDLDQVSDLPSPTDDAASSQLLKPELMPISTHRQNCIPLPVFRCQQCGTSLCTTEILKAVRDLISRRGTDIWFALEAEEIIPANTTCTHCSSNQFQKEPLFFDGRFAMLLFQLTQLDNLPKSPNLQLVYFSGQGFPSTKSSGGPTQTLFHRWFRQFSLIGLAIQNRLPLEEVLFLGADLPTPLQENFCTELLDRYPPDLLRISLLKTTTEEILDSSIQRAQAIYATIDRYLSNQQKLTSRQICAIPEQVGQSDQIEENLPDKFPRRPGRGEKKLYQRLEEIDQAYEMNDFRKALQLIFDLATAADANTTVVSIQPMVAFLQRLAPIMPFSSEQTYTTLKASIGAVHHTLTAESIFLTDWINYDAETGRYVAGNTPT